MKPPSLIQERNAYRDNPSKENSEAYIAALEARLKFTQDLKSKYSRRDGNITRLANLGMALEIGGHEFARIRSDFDYNWRQVPEEVKASEAGEAIFRSFDELTNAFADAQAMQASRNYIRKLTGEDIASYVDPHFRRRKVEFTPAFKAASLYSAPSRLYPLLFNLIGNAVIWSEKTTAEQPQVIVDVVDDEIVVSDNGPGVPEENIPFIFDPLFTEGNGFGKGVGLYLVKKCAESQIMKVRYERPSDKYPLGGANFVLSVPSLETEE